MRAKNIASFRTRIASSILLLSGLIVDVGQKAAQAEEPTPITPAKVDELRARFPYQSLEARLKPLSRRANAKPVLDEHAEARLEKLEDWIAGYGDVRSRSLAMLHSKEVEKFFTAEGFGVERVIRGPAPPSLRHLDYRESPAVAFDVRPDRSTEGQSSVPISLPTQGVREETGGGWTPSNELLSRYQLGDQLSFANPESFGHLNSERQVAGFRSHGFRSRREIWHPQIKYTPTGPSRRENWRAERIELVSLLKFDEPAVYESEHLPRMAELDDAKTRPLNEFENQSLPRIYRGEDIVTDATTNEIKMVGAIRAAQQCADCHGVERGTLLGAFSYKLYRDPPLQEPKVQLTGG